MIKNIEIQSGEISKEAGSRREKILEEINYLSNALEAEEYIPQSRVSRASQEEPLLMVQANYFAGIKMHILNLLQGNFLATEGGVLSLQAVVKEIAQMEQEIKLLEYELQVDDELSPFQAFEQIRELRKRQIPVLKGLILKTLAVLQEEKNRLDQG